MRILHLECGPHWGGQEIRTVRETEWMLANGHPTWIGCAEDSKIAAYARLHQIPHLVIPMEKSRFLKAVFKIRQFCRAEKIEVIHTHGSKDSALALPFHLAGMPVVRSRHIMLPARMNFQKRFIFHAACRHIIACSGQIASALATTCRIAPEKISVIGEAVDTQKFNPKNSGIAFREELGISDTQPLIGMLGMIRSEKGQRAFLKAALKVLETHKEARFVMVGEGVGESGKRIEKELQTILTERIGAFCSGKERHIPINLAGHRNDAASVFAAMDIVVVPSKSEGQSQVVPEAFASGKPVIASNVGGLPELVRHEENGLLVKAADPDEIAQAICRLLEDSALRKRLAEAGLAFANRDLSLDAQGNRILAVYKNAVS